MNVPTFTFKFYGDNVTLAPDFGQYGNGRLAIMMDDADTGEQFGTVTVNMPNDHLNDGEVFVKDWSENEVMVAGMVAAGWLVHTGREVASGYVNPKVMKLGGELLDYLNSLGIKW